MFIETLKAPQSMIQMEVCQYLDQTIEKTFSFYDQCIFTWSNTYIRWIHPEISYSLTMSTVQKEPNKNRTDVNISTKEMESI